MRKIFIFAFFSCFIFLELSSAIIFNHKELFKPIKYSFEKSAHLCNENVCYGRIVGSIKKRKKWMCLFFSGKRVKNRLEKLQRNQMKFVCRKMGFDDFFGVTSTFSIKL